MERLRCVAERITYANEESGYAVLKVRVKNYVDLVTAVGGMANINVGSVLTLTGEWKTDSKYGRQFSVKSWEETMPATVFGIEKYLGSGMIKGIGPKFAKRIVSMFGTDTLTVIEDTPDRLLEIEGIGGKRVAMIKKAWQDQKEIKNIMLFLQEHQVSTTHAFRIYKAYENEAINIVRENPYKLADDIWGIGFKTADGIAEKMGFDKESAYRLRSGLFYILNGFADNGHCFALKNELIQKAAQSLEVNADKLEYTLEHMLLEKDVILDAPDRIYLPAFYVSEIGVAKWIHKILGTPATTLGSDIENMIAKAEQSSGLIYDTIQKDAIRMASRSKVMVLTGGPGVGKTTTVKGIIAAMSAQGLKILLAAPTGRAAKRLSEVTGLEAKTIHRLLECKPPEGYVRNEDNPLEGDILIVDECSMIDIILMYNLLKAVPNSMRVLLVGDADQLPAVGAGNVLPDIIKSGRIPVVKLTVVYRQAQASRIITNAHQINRGEFPNLSGGRGSDFFFIEEEDPAKIPGLICGLCAERLPHYYQANPIHGIQVLTPMRRGETGAANLNILLQEALNPNKPSLRRGGTEYRLGDKVMQIKNNYDKEVFNGDIGVITGINQEDRTLTVMYDNTPVEYDSTELDELVLAYATSIHKAQGSEYPIVVMPFTTQHFMMLQRNLLYTGITRAKKTLVIVGTKKAIGIAVKNNKVTQRNTALAERLDNFTCQI